MTHETRRSPPKTGSHEPAYRVTDRSGVVHVVTDLTSTWTKVACGLGFSRGTGRPRVWQLVPGHHHEICITCSRANSAEQLTAHQRSEGT
jgi:hypothetical protein